MEWKSRKGSTKKGGCFLFVVCYRTINYTCADCFVLWFTNEQLFALGYGIKIEDVQKKDAIRSITGERDYF